MPKAPSVLQDKEADVPDIAPVYPHVLRVPPKPCLLYTSDAADE